MTRLRQPARSPGIGGSPLEADAVAFGDKTIGDFPMLKQVIEALVDEHAAAKALAMVGRDAENIWLIRPLGAVNLTSNIGRL